MKKILILSPYAIHRQVDHAGGKEIYRMIRAIQSEYEITLYCVVRDISEENLVLAEFKGQINVETFRAQPLWKIILKKFPWSMFVPIDIIKDYNVSMENRVRDLLKEGGQDIVQCEYLSTSQYILNKQNRTAVVLDEIDLAFIPLLRWAKISRNPIIKLVYYLRSLAIYYYERKALDIFDGIITKSNLDKERVLRLAPNANVCVYSYPIKDKDTVNIRPGSRRPAKLVFFGSIRRRENLDAINYFIDQIYPLVRKQKPEVELQIIGACPPEKIKKYDGKEGISVLGWVEDPDQYLFPDNIFIAPIRIGGGIIIKVLEAISRGMPVVASSIANEGIGARDGHEILIADSPVKYADCLVDLLSNPQKAKMIGMKGKEFISREYNYDKRIGALLEFYKNIRPRKEIY